MITSPDYQAATDPIRAANRSPPTFNETASLEGALVVEAPCVLPALLLDVILEPEVELPVLWVLLEEVVLVDMVDFVLAPLVDMEEVFVVIADAVVAAAALVDAAEELVMAAELTCDDCDSTVFFDSTTKGAE